MAIFSSLPPGEQARQLANPEGQVGIEVAEWLNGNNREGNARTLALLRARTGNHVLEIGFGNGRTAPDVLAQAADVQYAGIDISPTMVDEATRFNAALVAAGRARFHLASAEHMPFEDASLDRVFSTGVIHFWKDALDSRAPPPFARPEFGFHLRSAAEWAELCRQAGFDTVDAQNIESEAIAPDGTPTRRYTLRLTLRR